MESYEFEVKCKNAIISILKEIPYYEAYTIKDIKLVWFCKSLKNFKGLFIDNGRNSRYYECTYDGGKDKLYVDIYVKKDLLELDGSQLTDKVNI